MNILVVRFSALGDLVMLLPVLQKLKKNHPHINITVVSRPFVAPLFQSLDIDFFAADLHKRHQGFWGIYRLSKDLRKHKSFHYVFDLHSVLRSRLLCFFLKLGGISAHKLVKNRKGRKKNNSLTNKQLRPLRPVSATYADTFRERSIDFSFNPHRDYRVTFIPSEKAKQLWKTEKASVNIGIAPFAKHETKEIPTATLVQAIHNLDSKQNLKIWWFGGPGEAKKLEEISSQLRVPTSIIAGKLDLYNEIAIMQHFDAFVAMDSSNMHMAAIAGIPVVSIWGSTHPYNGFAPFGDNESLIVQVDQNRLACRPCSTFGNKKCARGDQACLHWIEAASITEKINLALSKKQKTDN